MIKIYGMESCPDCTYVWDQVQGDARYEVIDFGLDVRQLKAFLKLRDNDPAFAAAKARGAAGIPCFLLEDGRVTLLSRGRRPTLTSCRGCCLQYRRLGLLRI